MSDALIVLEDGMVLPCRSVGASGTALGEMVFTTGMNGYQEAVTDPSYLGQILTFSAPMIGNYGTGDQALESPRVWPGAVIATRIGDSPGVAGPVGFRSWLAAQGVVAVEDADTRRLVRHLRDHGAMRGGVSTGMGAEELLALVREHPHLDGRDLSVDAAGARRSLGGDGPTIVAVDCGMKQGILTGLAGSGMRVEVVPAGTTDEEILALDPDGVCISNGPGDPAACVPVIDALSGVLGKVPVFGICLGHQLLSHALGLRTEKLPFGHRGANHPVQRAEDGVVEITVQNHGYAVVADSLPDGVEVTRTSLFDGSVEGIAAPDVLAASVQYHPEARPGPHDATYLFRAFRDRVAA